MIDFGNFYSLIAKNHLSHWLETLPTQIANWQREQQHGCFQCRNAPADLPTGEQDDAPDDAGTAQQHFPDAVPPDMHPDFPPQSSKCGFSFLPLRSINCLFYPFP